MTTSILTVGEAIAFLQETFDPDTPFVVYDGEDYYNADVGVERLVDSDGEYSDYWQDDSGEIAAVVTS